jgi:hypothetical protein
MLGSEGPLDLDHRLAFRTCGDGTNDRRIRDAQPATAGRALHSKGVKRQSTALSVTRLAAQDSGQKLWIPAKKLWPIDKLSPLGAAIHHEHFSGVNQPDCGGIDNGEADQPVLADLIGTACPQSGCQRSRFKTQCLSRVQ